MPNYFDRKGTKHGGAAALDIAEKQDEWTSALVDSVAYARALPGVDPSRIGMLGFSLGGYLCLRARAASRVRRSITEPATCGPPSSLMRRRLRQYSSSKVPTSRSANTRTPRTPCQPVCRTHERGRGRKGLDPQVLRESPLGRFGGSALKWFCSALPRPMESRRRYLSARKPVNPGTAESRGGLVQGVSGRVQRVLTE
jgi:hypothetical protein